MKPKTAETLAWVLIYSGLLIASLGWFVWSGGTALGGVLIAAGLADTAVGVALIWLRSRMNEETTKETR